MSLFLIGMFVFVTMLIGIFLTMRELRRISERPDLFKRDVRPQTSSDSALQGGQAGRS